MSVFSYELPDPGMFLSTLRRYLAGLGENEIAGLLKDCTCNMSTTGFYSGQGNDHHDCTIFLRVRLELLMRFTDKIKLKLIEAADQIMPGDAGFDVTELVISPHLDIPRNRDLEDGLNVAVFEYNGAKIHPHDGLRFRSYSETCIYDELKKRNVLFFPNTAAILGGAGENSPKKEPDFLVCSNGKWGIFEVMGDDSHPSETAMVDHERARLFKNYGVLCIEFYAAQRCRKHPASVVDDFLKRLEAFKG